MTNWTQVVLDVLDHQPHGIYIGHGRYPVQDPASVPFHYLCRQQQVAELFKMLQWGVELLDLQYELYLVCHLSTEQVWNSFGLITDFPELYSLTDYNSESDDDDDIFVN